MVFTCGAEKYLEARITGGAETRGENGLHVAARRNTWRRGSQEGRRRGQGMVFTWRRGEIPGGADHRRRGDAGSEWSSRCGAEKYLEARIAGGAETRAVNGLHVAARRNTWRRGSQEARRRGQ